MQQLQLIIYKNYRKVNATLGKGTYMLLQLFVINKNINNTTNHLQNHLHIIQNVLLLKFTN
jgi:hypothetical protein